MIGRPPRDGVGRELGDHCPAREVADLVVLVAEVLVDVSRALLEGQDLHAGRGQLLRNDPTDRAEAHYEGVAPSRHF